jgi:hypothetical protein
VVNHSLAGGFSIQVLPSVLLRGMGKFPPLRKSSKSYLQLKSQLKSRALFSRHFLE